MIEPRLRYEPGALFAYMDERGIKENWLATKLGVTRGHLNNIKWGRAAVPEWMPEKAAEALDVPVDQIFPKEATRVAV